MLSSKDYAPNDAPNRTGSPPLSNRFLPIPVEIPLLPGKTVRECMYKLLDNAMLEGLDTDSPEIKHALGEPLEFSIDHASRLMRLVCLVNLIL